MLKPNSALRLYELPPTLYSIMESIVNYGKDDKKKIKNLPNLARGSLFNFDYPISEYFDELADEKTKTGAKEYFETLLLKHYMFRRINFDTVTSFRLHLDVKLNEIMPKYNKMIESFFKLNFDGYVETHTRVTASQGEVESSGSGTTSNTSQDSTTTDNRYSSEPQEFLSDVRDGKYISDYTYIQTSGNGTSSSTSTNSATTTNEDTVNENIKIIRANSIEELQKYMSFITSIYGMIFHELDSLFFGIV